MRLLRLATSCLTALALGVPAVLAVPTPARAAQASIRDTGYLTMADGVRLKYTVLRPDDDARHPVLMQYEGYNAGSNPTRVNADFTATMLRRGYAILGVSIRGTACSEGEFDLFSPTWGTDGRTAVEWAAKQPWSSGKVGMFSFSYAGIAQLLTAETRPPHLVAIAPGMVVADMYRDVGYPGGIMNAGFAALWEAALHTSWAQAAPQALQEGDAGCVARIAEHQALGIPDGVGVSGLQHPYRDSYMRSRSPITQITKIDVPVLGEMAWQDEQTGPRGGLAFERLNPKTTWRIGSNGMHGMYAEPTSRAMLQRFFDHYLRGDANGWTTTAHYTVLHEVSTAAFEPSWITRSNRPDPGRISTWWLQPDGGLARTEPDRDGGATAYLTPTASPAVLDEELAVGQATNYGLTWQASPINPLGTAEFTTGKLTRDLTLSGSGSLDLWLRSQVGDADVQATITEVRPDGQETYVQRGWLRLSHRALEKSSTRTLPVHPHTAASLRAVPAASAIRARVEVLPFTHTFRKGSRLRIWLDTPSYTGLWEFVPNPAAATTLSVLHDAAHPSRFVIRSLRGRQGRSRTPLPACNTLASQPCRADPLATGMSVGIP